MTSEFETVYGVEGKEMETYQATQAGVTERKVVDGAKELNSWAWQYGQTPEFTNDLEGETSVGKVVSGFRDADRIDGSSR